jgi:hypothetical protein
MAALGLALRRSAAALCSAPFAFAQWKPALGKRRRQCCSTPRRLLSFESRLSEVEAAGHSDGESYPPSKKKNTKKRKLRDDGSGSDEEADDDPVAAVCEHCGGAVPEVSLRVACLDGTTLDVRVAQRGLVLEVKRLVGQVRVVTSSAARVCFCYGERVDSQRA